MVLLAFESAPSKTNSLADCTIIFTQKARVHIGKVLKKKDIVQMMSTSIKGRHSINAEMNAESFEYGDIL